MHFKGTAHRYGRDIDTDVIIPARYLNSSDPEWLAAHCLEDLDKDFVKKVRKGDIITLEFAKALEVKLGNAGGVQVSYDGTELPAPGQAGQVKTLVFPPAAN